VQRAKAYAEWLGSRGTLLEAPVPQIRLAGPSVTFSNVTIRNEPVAQAEVGSFAKVHVATAVFLSLPCPLLPGDVHGPRAGLEMVVTAKT
jgi:hypothetical protein